MRIPLVALVLASTVVPAPAQSRQAAPFVVFHTQDFWLNLHQFLYVLGRHEAGMPDRTRRATAGAPMDAANGLGSLSNEEQRGWREAVSYYAAGPSKQDAVFDEPLIRAGQALARSANASSLARADVDPAISGTLARVAPLYRKAWWDAHRRANESWAETTRVLIDTHGPAIVSFITRAYQLPWPKDGYPVHVSAYANWAGAFSTRGNLLIMSSLDPGNQGSTGLEITFHEAMHQWDDAIDGVLSAEATKQQRTVPNLLSHALIFYTAGEAARSVVPGHVPYAEVNGLWRQRGLGAFKQALDEVWRPYLQGNGTREAALAALLARTKN